MFKNYTTAAILFILLISSTGFASAPIETGAQSIVINTSGAGPNAMQSESFDGLVLPAGWIDTAIVNTYLWTFVATGTYPTCIPHSGTGMATYQSYSYSSGSVSWLITPSFSLTTGQGQVSFWMYRDPGYSSNYDSIGVWVNTAPDLTGASWIANIWRYNATPDWYYFSYNIPASYNGPTNYLIFVATSAYGNNMYFDDVSWGVPTSMVYDSSTTVQLLDGITVPAGTSNNQIIQIQVATSGNLNPLSATSFNLGTNGSTNPTTDITNAKLYYTGTSNAFSTTNLLGTAVSPNGTFTINGSQVLSEGTNYFWLTYDVPGTATQGDTLDAQCNSVTVGGTPHTPSVTAPSGFRTILGATLCGTYTIPGSYPSIEAAIADLNAFGVCGTSPVIFNVAAGHIDTAANLVITASGTAAGPIIFQKSGSGANPLIIAGTGTSTTLDGIIILSGADYITFDGIDLQESDANTTTTTQMECGYALLKVDGTDGSQNNTIKNCTITLNKTNTNSKGIYSANHTTTSTTNLTVTAFTGTNSSNKFYNNTIQNSYTGIYVYGYADASPYAYYDHFNEIGVDGGNIIRDFGGSSSATYGIYTSYQDSISVSNNDVAGGTGSTSYVYGLYIYYGYNSSVYIYNNTVSDTTASTTINTYGIYVYYAGYSGVDNTVTIKRNTVQGMTSTASTTGYLYGYYIYYTTAYNLNIDSNKFVDNKWGGPTQTATGYIYGFYVYPYTTSPLSGSVENITNNYIAGNTRTQSTLSSGYFYGMYLYYGDQTVNVYNNIIENDTTATTTSTSYYMYVYNYYATTASYYNNIIRNIYKPSGTGTIYGFYISNAAYTGTFNFHDNSIYNISTLGSVYPIYIASTAVEKNIYKNTAYSINTSSTGAIYGMYNSGGTDCYIYQNNIHSLSSLTGVVYGVYLASGTTNYFYNNFISNLQSSSSTNTLGVAGLYIGGGTNDYIFYNTIYLDAVSTSSSSFGTAGVYASTSPTIEMSNNIIDNKSTPGPTGGYTTAYQRSSSTLTSYSSASNNNDFHAGLPSADKLIFYDGTNADQTIGDFKSRVAPADSNSFTENPPFINVTTPPYNLHISTSIPTGVESAGKPITSPIAITTDYDGQTRNATTPDVGADEGNFIPGDLQAPEISYTPLGNTGTISDRNLVATITDNYSVQNTPPNDPRIYFKKGINATYKYRNKTSQAGNDFTFTIVVDSLGGLSTGDTVFYYIAAQDTAPTPNIATNPAGGSGINPPGTTPPPSPNFYLIIAGPMSGVFTIPGSYPSISAAIGDLNLRGIGGPCTFNVAQNHVEVASNIVLTTTGTASNPIVFQKALTRFNNDDPLLNNPAIVAAPGIGTMDGIIILNGADYVTFDGIDVRDTSANSNNTTKMEWGYALLKVDGTDGSQNNTIKNCEISLDKSYTSTYGIYSANHTTSSTTTIVVTAISGENSNNKFYNNTIHNCYSGIFVGGYADASPYNYYDNGNDIGSLGGNTIRDFGGSSSSTFGIYTTYQDSLTVSNNDIGGGTGSTSTCYGIYVYYGYNANVTVYNNTISDTTATLSSSTYGIAVYYAGNSGVDNTVTVKRNTVQGMTNTAAGTSCSLYGYYIYYTTSYNLNIDSNKFVNNKWGNETGTFTGAIYSFYNYVNISTPTSGSVENITNNYIAGNKKIQSTTGSGSHYGMYNYYGLETVNSYNNMVENDTLTTTSTNYGIYMYHYYSTTANIHDNTVRNIYKTEASTASYYGIYLSNAAPSGTCNYYNNSVDNIRSDAPALMYGQYLAATSVTKNLYGNSSTNLYTTGTGNVYGMLQSSGTTVNFYKNKIDNIRTGSGYAYGLYISSGTTNNIYNNFISDIKSDSSANSPGVYGMYISGGTNDNVYYNSIYLNSVSTGTTFGTTTLYASTTPTLDLRNNIIVNMSTPGSSNGNAVAFQRSSATLTTYSDSSNNNCFYSGAPGTNHLIYYDGTNSDSTIEQYKTLVAPRDANSFSENPPFVNVSTPPYNLHLQTTVPTRCESGALPITNPPITDDYDGDSRNTSTPDVGADEGNFTPYVQFPNLTLKVYLEGFYSPEPLDNKSKGLQQKNTRGSVTRGLKDEILAQVEDTVRIYLADSLQSYALVDSVTVYMPSTGSVTTPFTGISTGKYYIVVRHRNHLETWSKYAVSFTGGSTTTYDFTTAASQAYGDNMKQVGSVWVLYGGDPNQDGEVGALDIPIFISQFGTQGYLSCDFNGDGDVTGVDQQILIQNYGLTVARPGTVVLNPANRKELKELKKIFKEIKKNNE